MTASPTERLARELEHDRRITERADEIWNWDSPAGRRRADRRAAFFVEHARLGPGVRAIELGCGTGLFLARVARSGATILGVELSPTLLHKAQDRVGSFPNVALERGDAHRLAHADASVDAVYGSSILHHLDLRTSLREAHRVLKPGGRIAFTEPNIRNPQVAFMFLIGPRSFFGLSPDEMAFSRSRALGALEDIGYTDAVVTPFDFLHPATPEGWLDPVARLGERLEAAPGLRSIAGSLLIHARKR
jgi:SAM-dependent methyltransferase